MQNVATAPRPAADAAMRRLLRIPEGHTASEGAAQRAFSTSVLVSATRCILTYLVLPFLLPVLGLAAGVGPAIGMMLAACTLSSWALGSPVAAAVILGAGAVGTWYIGWRVPTREVELARRTGGAGGVSAGRAV